MVEEIITAENDSMFADTLQFFEILGARDGAVVERLVDFGRLTETPPPL
jgi:hypothetical protein